MSTQNNLAGNLTTLPTQHSTGTGLATPHSWNTTVITTNTTIDLNGPWASGGVQGPVFSTTGNSLSIDMSAYHRPTAHGSIIDSSTITATFPDDKTYTAKLQPPDTILWSNHSFWTKVLVLPLGPLGSGTNTLATSHGSIEWSLSADGTIHAESGGQELISSRHSGADGSFDDQTEYSLHGGVPYLTLHLTGDSSRIACTLKAGSSQLTLTVAAMDPQMRGGTATLSGVWNGSAVKWTGFADLTSNPFQTHPISGWPAGAFTSELNQALIFAPLGTLLGRGKGGPMPVTTPNGVQFHVLFKDGDMDRGDAGRALSWCVGGAFAGAIGGEFVGGAAGCLGGMFASLGSDYWTWLTSGTGTLPPDPGQGSQSPQPQGPDDGAQQPPAPTQDPPDPIPSGPVCLPGDGLENSGSGGAGKPIDGDDPSTHHEED